jgi:hypothetical protein
MYSHFEYQIVYILHNYLLSESIGNVYVYGKLTHDERKKID